VVIWAKYAEMGRTEGGAFHRRLLLLRLPSCRVWNRGGTWDRAGLLADGVRYPKCSSICFIVFAARTRGDLALAAIVGFLVLTQLSKSFVSREVR
jgi:hypothetical protein